MYNGFISPYKEKGSYLNNFYNKNGTLDSILNATSLLENRSFNNTFNTSFIINSIRSKNELSINFDFLNYTLRSEQQAGGTTIENGNELGRYLLISRNPFTTNIYSFQTDFLRKIWSNGKLETGFQYTYSNRRNSGYYTNIISGKEIENLALNNSLQYKEHIKAAYFNLRKSMGCLTMQTGLRIEYTSASADNYSQAGNSIINLNYTDFFPTIYFAYKLDKKSDHLLDLSFGRRITRPDYQDLNPSIFFFDRNTSNKGNANLRPDYSLNYELNYSYKRKFTSGLFYSVTRNKITRVYTQLDNAFTLTPINLDMVEVMGLNANYYQPFFKWWTASVYGELTYSNYRGLILDEEFLHNNITSTRFSLNNKLKLSKDWNAELSGQYRGSRILGQGVYKPIGQINAGIQGTILDGNGTLSLNLRDILHTWNVSRSLSIPHLDVYSTNLNDTQQISISFAYRFGKSSPARARKNAIQSEAARAGAK